MMQGWYFVESSTGQRHDRVQTESQEWSIVDSVFEECLYHQLCTGFDDLLVSRQSAFRKHHGCDTALIDLIENWKLNLDSKRSVGVVSLDLSEAFDSLSPDLLLAKPKLNAYPLWAFVHEALVW